MPLQTRARLMGRDFLLATWEILEPQLGCDAMPKEGLLLLRSLRRVAVALVLLAVFETSGKTCWSTSS